MAIADKLTTLNTIKTNIKTAINGKGGSVGDDFTTYATAITNLPSGGGSQDLQDLIERDITSIDIPSGTTTIGIYAFSNCTSLASVTIPNSVTEIGESAFRNCSGLTSITIPNSVTSIGGSTFYGCTGLTSVTIPNSVTSIGVNAFRDCSGMTSVTIPNSVTSIGTNAFQNCSGLTSLTISNSVTTINNDTFRGCSNLPSITIPSSVTTIGVRVFQDCTSLTSITCLATTPPTIGNVNTFQNVPANCAIYVPAASVDTYKAAQYWSSRAAYIQAIPEPIVIEYTTESANQQVTITNNQALFNSITIDGTPQTIGTGALTHTFATAGVHEVSFILVSNTGISGSAFNNCYDITSVSLPDSITTIGYEVFYGCSNMTAITLPSSLVTIGDYAFADCSSLFDIISRNTTPPTIYSDTFYNVPADCVISVPDSSVSAYQAAQYWSDRAAYITAIPE